jgi:hypothetical protein
MIILFLLSIIIGGTIGVYWERHRWTKASKNRKAVGVDGVFYKVHHFDPETGKEF